jgi:uncharacterized protein (DUF362 family)
MNYNLNSKIRINARNHDRHNDGTGGIPLLHVIYGSDPKNMVKEILKAMRPETGVKKDALIGLKPNLVAASPASTGATTSPQVTAGIIEYFQEKGFGNLLMLESAWVGDSTVKAFEVCGYNELSRTYKVPLMDLKKDKVVAMEAGGLKINVCAQIRELDYLINIPVLKAHCQTRLTCALKNLKGVIPDSEKRRFHSLGLHKPIAALNKLVKTDLIIVDAIMGDLTYEGGGNPVEMARIIGGTDPVMVDSYVAGLLGLRPEDVAYISLAEKLGVGRIADENTPVEEYRRENYPAISLEPSPRVQNLARRIVEKSACSPCYGALVHALFRLEEEGLLKSLPEKIHLGRDFKGESLPGVGVGLCTAGFTKSISGCPPKAREILEFLKETI